MADKEIGDLTAASALDGTETVHVVQGGNSRRTTTQGIADLTTLSGLSDVDVASAMDGNVLKYDASNGVWFPATDESEPAFRGALVRNDSTLTAFNASVGDNAIPWANEVYDTSGFHSTSSNTSRLTVPAGVSYVRLTCNLLIGSIAAGTDIIMSLAKNGTLFGSGGFRNGNDALLNYGTTVGISGILPVVEGDYFEATLFVNGDSSVDISSTSFFQIEVIE